METKTKICNEYKRNDNFYHVTTFLKSVIFKAFIYECLRISSIAPRGISHTCNQDTQITINENKKWVIPANSWIILNIAYIQRGLSSNECWKNKKYNLLMNDICLQNWLVEDNNGNLKFKMNESFVAFGVGTRDCVGQQLALKEIYLIIGYLILHYQFCAQNNDTSFEIKRRDGLTVEIENEVPVLVTKRLVEIFKL